jgi:hypothetical protein
MTTDDSDMVITPTRVYLAASYARKKEMRTYRDQLHQIGCMVTSRWIDNADKYANSDVTRDMMMSEPDLCYRYAMSDLEDIMSSHMFVLFTGDKQSSGGRHTEFGIAMMMLGRSEYLSKICIVGPRENVFQCHSKVWQFDTWADFMAAFYRGCTLVEADEFIIKLFESIQRGDDAQS